MIVQYESKKRSFTFICGGHTADVAAEAAFVSNTGGDFDPAPVDEGDFDDDEAEDRFGFWPQAAA